MKIKEERKGGEMKKCIEEYSTKELHDELIKRGGVESYFLDPYIKGKLILEDKEINLEGPATIFVIVD